MPDLCCSHGSLARACELCFRDGEIAELRALLGEARNEIGRMMNHLADDSGPTHTYDEDDCERTFALEARIYSALATRAEPVRESFEEWHKRKCPDPETCETWPDDPWADWLGHCAGKTCRDVYESEVPGASRTPSDGVSGKPAGRPSPAGGGAEPPPTGTNPAEELAEAAIAYEDARQFVGSTIHETGAHLARARYAYDAALEKYREGRKS